MSVKQQQLEQFEVEHREWVEQHLARRSGERKRRLEEGHRHGEKEFLKSLWWPMTGHFRYLHPEYEVIDFMEGRRYVDIAYIRGPIKIAFEIDGFGPHWRDISRRQFADQWVRHMQLINDGWIIIRISYDDLKERPRLWQQMIQQLLGQFFGDPSVNPVVLPPNDRELIKLALRLPRSLKLADVEQLFSCNYRTARRIITRLENDKWLLPLGIGKKRTHSWKMNAEKRGVARSLL